MRWQKWLYEGFMVFLALTVVGLLAVDKQPWVTGANLVIWAIFVVDYGVRLLQAPSRWRFVRENPTDLLTILPLDYLRVFRLVRLIRIIRLFRAGMILWRVSKDVRGILGTNGLGFLLMFTASMIVVGGSAVWLIEPRIGSLVDGIWWGVVTATTVGYGDIAPQSGMGRLVAIFLMILGIGTIGMITGSIANYFMATGRQESKNPHLQYIKTQLDQWDVASPEERRQLAVLLMALATDEPVGEIETKAS